MSIPKEFWFNEHKQHEDLHIRYQASLLSNAYSIGYKINGTYQAAWVNILIPP